MEELIELLKQIQDLAGAGIDALESVTSGGGAPEGGEPGGPGGAPKGGPGGPGGAPKGGPGGPPESGPPEGGPGGPPEGGPPERRR